MQRVERVSAIPVAIPRELEAYVAIGSGAIGSVVIGSVVIGSIAIESAIRKAQ